MINTCGVVKCVDRGNRSPSDLSEPRSSEFHAARLGLLATPPVAG